MKFVDTHTHAWGAETAELPWTAEVLPPGWSGPYTHDALIADMDRLSIAESVIVTTPLYGRGVRANEYTMRSIEAHPDRLYGVGLLDFFAETAATDVDRVVGHDRMLGVRMHAPFEYAEIPAELNRTADWILDRAIDPVWERLNASGACMFIFPKAEQLPMVAELAERHPDVPIVIDHMAWPDETTDPDEEPWTDFQLVSDHANTYVKISSLPRSATQSWPYEDLHGYVRNLLDWFGPSRLMLGSDYPWMDDWDSYEHSLSWVEEASFISAKDLSYLSYRTFDQLFR